MRASLPALIVGATMVATGCSPSDGGVPATTPGAPTSAPPTTQVATATDLPDGVVAYLKAWAANDVATMVGNAAPASPARAYAEYWGDVYRAGRLDSGPGELQIRRSSAVLSYPDGSRYRLSDFDANGNGVSTWTAAPGGPLAPRIVSGRTTTRVAGVRVTAGTQYENTESSVRIVLTLRNGADDRRDIQTPVYVSPDGTSSTAALGADGRTGVVPVAAGSELTALVAADDAVVGGRLRVRVFDAAGDVLGSAVLALPR